MAGVGAGPDGHCPACASVEGRVVRTGLRHGLRQYGYVECAGCGLVAQSPFPTPEEIARTYDDPEHDEAYYRARAAWYERQWRYYAGKLLPLLTPESRVLDVGCGYGGLLRALRGLGVREALGIDRYSPTRDLTVREFGVEVIFAEFESYDFGNRRFDLIVSQHTLEHVPRPDAALGKMAALLRPGGRLVVSVPNFASRASRWFGSAWLFAKTPQHLYLYTASVLGRLLAKAGFQVERVDWFDYYHNVAGYMGSLPWERWGGTGRALRLVARLAVEPVVVLDGLMRQGASICLHARRPDGVSAHPGPEWATGPPPMVIGPTGTS